MKTLISFLFFTLITVQNVQACKCKKTNFETAYKHTKIIAKGIVKDICYKSYAELLTPKEFNELSRRFKTEGINQKVLNEKQFIEIELEISCTYKGNISSDRIKVYTSNYSSMCGYKGFEFGKTFILYLFERQLTNFLDIPKLVYVTDNCTRTKPFEKEEDLMLCNAINQ